MLALAADLDPLAAAAGQGLGDGRVRVERFAALVEGGHAEIGAEPDRAGVRRSAPVSRFRSVVLPAPFGPTMPSRSPRRIRSERSRTIALPSNDFETAFGFDDELARELGLRERHRGKSRGPALLAKFRPHRIERPHPALVALAARGDAVAQPVGLGGELAVELVPVALLLLEDGVAPGLEIGKAAIDPARDPAVEPDRCLRQVFQEAPVVADEHEGGAEAASSPSSHSIAGRSRWLVGSSSSRMSGSGASTRASAARRASPPERFAGASSPVSPSSSSR